LENGSGGEPQQAAISSVRRGTRSGERGLLRRLRPRASSSRIPRRAIPLRRRRRSLPPTDSPRRTRQAPHRPPIPHSAI